MKKATPLKISTFFIRLGGGEPGILELVPSEAQRFILNGILNLLNALILAGSLYMIGNDLFSSELLHIIVPITFGLMELFIVQYMGVTLYSGRSRWLALPRILLSAVFAFSVSQIIQVELFRETITATYHGLHPQLKAGDSLSISFIERLEIFSKLSQAGNTIWWMSVLITLMFIGVGALPYLSAFFSRGNSLYAHVLHQQAEERLEELKIADMKMRLKVDAELKANDELLKAIAEKQTMLAKKAVETWYQHEIAKLNVEEIRYDQRKGHKE
jgi:hypothetical protein